MALAGTETATMYVAIDDATKRTAAAVVVAHVPADEVPLVLHVLGYALRTPLVLDLPPSSETCRNGHPQSGGNVGRTANGMAFCVACDTDRKAARYQREHEARS
jgi:hypothetical protein